MTISPEVVQGLPEARQQCHYAVQFISRFGRAYLAPLEDDSHTSMMWAPGAEALQGQPLVSEAGTLQIGVSLHDLTMLLCENPGQGAKLPLAHRTVEEVAEWLQGQLASRGLDPSLLMKPLHYEIPDHPLAHGAAFQRDGLQEPFERLSGLYQTTDAMLHALPGPNASPVRCWPHHFDMAVLFKDGERTLNAGVSPGDGEFALPYYYVSPWPYPPAESLAPFEGPGRWHTEQWTGAVLPYEELPDDAMERGEQVRAFLTEAMQKLGFGEDSVLK